jgi:DinB family protein
VELIAELQQRRREFEASKTDARGIVAGLSHAQFNYRPTPDRWSIAECLVHLNTAAKACFPAIDRAIAAAQARGWTSAGPFRYGWLANWLVRTFEPPVRRRFRTAKIFRPAPPPAAGYRASDVLAEYVAVRDELLERVRRANGIDLRRAVVVSPANRLLRMSLGAYLAFLAAHDRRHLWQAQRVRDAAGFPSV